MGTSSLDPLVLSGSPPHCCCGCTMPLMKSTSAVRRPDTSATLKPANAPSRTATLR